METLRTHYLKASKKEKGKMLDEYCRNTGMDRKYVIKRFRYKAKVREKEGKGEQRKARKETYDGAVKAALAAMWKIFDYPCGQRLSSILKTETERMRTLGELACSDETAEKLKEIVPSTIDEKLKHEKEVERQKRKYAKTRSPLLCSKVPTKTSAELDRENPGVEQIDFVEHCGMSAAGAYVNSLSVTDLCSGWWEGGAVMGKGQERALSAIAEARERSPFPWREMHPDNGGNIMNYHLYQYAEKNGVAFSRSRPYKKNDNCFVEQKNSTHVRQVVGYLRYDTEEERGIIDDLYRNELRFYKNFFQPVMKLKSKTRIGGTVKKKYDTPKTPYRRLMESTISKTQKDELERVYESLNPADLKRKIDAKLAALYRAYQKKNGSRKVDARRDKKSMPSLVSFFIGQPVRV
jgi:hypothetical protein